MARLDLGFRRDDAGWPDTPGLAAAVERMSGAEEAHRRERSLRDAMRERDRSLMRLGRSLLESLSSGRMVEDDLPQPVRDAVHASRIAEKAMKNRD